MPGNAAARARALVARTARAYGSDAPETVEARRNYTAEKLAQYVADVVAAAPPLTDAQRERISQLLRAPAGGGVG